MKNKTHYYAAATNEQGAGMIVTHESSIRACENEARRTLGSGWKVYIMRVDIDGDGKSWMGETEIKTFTIRQRNHERMDYRNIMQFVSATLILGTEILA